MDISDLLVRHEKLVHLNESSGSKDGNKPRKPSSGGVAPTLVKNQVDTETLGMQHQLQRQHQQQQEHQQHQQHQQQHQQQHHHHHHQHHHHQQRPPQPHYPPEAVQSPAVSSLPPDSRHAARAPACNLDLLSDAATHLASGGEVNNLQPSMMQGLAPPPPDLAPVKAYHESVPYGDRPREQDPPVIPAGYAAQPPPPAFDDYNLFLDDYATSSHFLPPSLEAEQGFGMWSRPLALEPGRGPSKPPSAFPSRFPSLQPDASEGAPRTHEDGTRAPSWRISAMDHTVIRNRLDEFSSVLPNDFVFPSRHTLNRFLEGYISGFHDHLPFLHLPTLCPTELSPELLLAMLAVGAQYRFETNRGHALWYAAKAVALEQIRRRNSHEVHGLLPTPAAYSPHSTRPSPSSGFRHSFPSVHHDRPMTQDTHREP